jgi:hypothetical protein
MAIPGNLFFNEGGFDPPLLITTLSCKDKAAPSRAGQATR